MKMFVRIHSFKFQNEFAKDTIKQKLKLVGSEFFLQGLLTQCFVDIDRTSLYMINTWQSEQASTKVFDDFKGKIFDQMQGMGVKVSILGGKADILFKDPDLLEKYTVV